jgi:hypothetical protein
VDEGFHDPDGTGEEAGSLAGRRPGPANTSGMRKIIALFAALVVVLPVAEATAGKARRQKVSHTIVAPQPYAADGTCIYRAQRALFSTFDEQANGYVGYTFEVNPKTAGAPFKLKVSDGAGVDISFYTELGDPTDPTTAPANMPFETPGPGGEKGKVPAGYDYAFVCMTEGQNATFTYTAGR